MPDSLTHNPFGQHPFIAIEGNIGSGKTTFCKMVTDAYDCNLILEQFTDNPFLPFFYEQPERYAFPVELFFMTGRHKQLQEHFSKPSLFQQSTISDYYFLKTLLFAKNNLSEEEFRLFQRLFGVLNNTFPKPSLVVYLHRPVEVLLEQIKKRGRPMEEKIAPAYLEDIQTGYLEHFKTEKEIPVLILELGDANFQESETIFNEMVQKIGQSYPKGIQVDKL